jgi:hypothetical protein
MTFNSLNFSVIYSFLTKLVFILIPSYLFLYSDPLLVTLPPIGSAYISSQMFSHINTPHPQTQSHFIPTCISVAYPDILGVGGLHQEFFGAGVQQIQLRIEGRENGDLGVVAP